MALATCRDGTSPQLTFAPVAVAPVFPSDASLASFGLTIDRVRFIVVRPSAPPDTIADTTVALPPDAESIDLDLRVPLISSAETLYVSIVAMSGSVPLFTGTAPVEVVSGATPSTPTDIPVLTYVGPGAAVDSIALSPAVPFIYFNDSLRFQVAAFQAGVPVSQFYISWSTSDSAVARVNGSGLLRAPAARTAVRVIARTPGGTASDSTTATFVPVPNQIAIITGAGQTAAAGTVLPTQLEVEVRAADNLPVPGVAVRFRSLSGGSPADTTMTTDAQGRARATGILGATPGPQSFQVSLPAFPGVSTASIGATATGVVISPATSVVTVSSGSVVSGNTVKLRLQTKDASGSDITSGGATVAFTRSGGASTGSITAAADSGNGVYTAVFTGLLAGTATTIGATINGAPVTSTLPSIAVSPGAISTAGSVITVSSGTVASGAAVTLRLRGKDAAGNNVSTGGDVVAFTASGGSSTGVIGAVGDSGNGVYLASFTGVLAGTGTSIGGSINGGAVTSAKPSVVVTPGTPAQLVFGAPPGAVLTGVVFSTPLLVSARDLAGNATPAFAGDVTIAIGTNPPGSGALAGTLTQTASAGIATFSDLAIDLPGIGYSLNATSPGLAGDSTASFDVVAPSGTIFWTNASGGNWSNPANWAGGIVPGAAETAAITIPGTYTVTLDVSDTVAGLQLGGSSGVQTLLAASKVLHVSGTSQVNANGLLWLKASTLAGGTLANGGKVYIDGATSITTGITTTVSALLRLQGNSIYSTATLTVPNGFTNTGTIVLTDTTSSYGAALNVSSGTLTNGPTGAIAVQPGALGLRTLGAQLDNQGMLTLSRSLTLSRASASHTNSGSIILVGANLTVNQSGSSPSFTNAGGTLNMGAGDSIKLNSGAFVYNGGSTISGGTLAFSSVTVTADQAITSQDAGLSIASTTWGGAGTLTIASGTTVVWRASSMTAPLDNQGTLVINGPSSFNGPFTNAAGATLQLQGNSIYSTAVLSVANSFTNNGAIVLTDVTSSYGATLTMPAGTTLTNAAGATIDAAAGTAGSRILTVQLANQGTLTLHRGLTLSRAGAAHTNSGTIDVLAGNLSVTQSGTSPSFANNSGSITMGAGDSVLVSSGSFAWNGGAITGGTLAFSSTTVTLGQDFSTATAGLSLASTTWGGTATLTIAPSTSVIWRASSISAPLVNQGTLITNGTSTFNGPFTNSAGATLQLQGNSIYSTATLNVTNSFTNNGAIVLTDVTSSYGATLAMPAAATLTNAPGATIDAAAGTAGTRTLSLQLDNQGTLTVHRDLTLSRASAAHVNTGTIDVLSGDLSITQSGTSPSFTNSGSGAITLGAGDSLKVSSGAFNYSGGTISGAGTFSVSSATVTATQSFSTATTGLVLASATWGGTGTLTVAGGTSLIVRASTINAPLVNQGTVLVNGTSAINGTFANDSGAMLRVQGNSFNSTGVLNVANGFTNDGAIELTDITSSYGATLNVTSGTLLNATGGTITALVGTNGVRNLNAQIDNRGTITAASASNQALTIAKPSAAHQNSGTIALTGGDLVISQSGTTPSFTNTGAISVAAGDTFRVNGGTFAHNAGSIGGAGAISLGSVTAAAFNVAHSIASLLITSSTATFATPQRTGATGFQFTSSTINGPGLLTNDLGRFLNVRASTINADLDNHGTLLVNGTSNFNGALTTGDTSVIQVQGNGSYSTGTMTVANGFTNHGAIELSDIVSSYGATLNVTTGTLANAPGASITALAGSNGPRTLGAALDNQGALVVSTVPAQALTITKLSADHLNSGTIDITAGDLTITQSGTTPSFTNDGAITIGTGDTLRVSGGAFTHNSGTLGGSGALVLSSVNPAAFAVAHNVPAMLVASSTVNFATPQATGATGFQFTSSTINGPGSLTNDAGRTLDLRSSTVNTPFINLGTLLVHGTSAANDTLTTATTSLIRIQGSGSFSTGTFTVAKGFENAGTVELTDTTSTYGATLVATNGSFLNLPGAQVKVMAGAGGPRTITAQLDNQGAVAVALAPGRLLTLNRASSTHSNTGTIDVIGGDVTIAQSGTTPSFTNLGAITVGGADTLTVNGGTFSYGGGSLDGPGTMVLSSVNPANFAKPHTLGSIIMTSSTASFAADDSTSRTKLLLTSSTLGGAGTLTNSPGKTLNIRSSSITAPLVNLGTLLVNGTSNLDALTTAAGSTVRVQGNGSFSTATLTLPNGMINNGAIEMTDTTSTYGATLVVKNLPLVNLGTMDIQPGSAGPRTIDATMDNQGVFTGNANVTINHPGALHTNRGLYKVKAGTITFAQSGGTPSFTNMAGGAIDIDSNTVFRVTSGPVTNALGGKIMGNGTLDVRAPAVFSHDGELIPGASPGTLTIAGNMQIPTSGIITIELGGPTAGKDYDQLVVTGNAVYAEGTLNVSTIGAFDPKGLTFDVLRFGSGGGGFRNFTVPTGCNQPSLAPDGKGIQVVCP